MACKVLEVIIRHKEFICTFSVEISHGPGALNRRNRVGLSMRAKYFLYLCLLIQHFLNVVNDFLRYDLAVFCICFQLATAKSHLTQEVTY